MGIFAPMRPLLSLILCACIACHGTEPKRGIAGTWSGAIAGTTQSLTLTLSEKNGSVSGHGLLTRSTGNLALTVFGEWHEPTLSVTMSASGFSPTFFNGSIMHPSEQLAGTITGSGFNGEVVAMSRQ